MAYNQMQAQNMANAAMSQGISNAASYIDGSSSTMTSYPVYHPPMMSTPISQGMGNGASYIDPEAQNPYPAYPAPAVVSPQYAQPQMTEYDNEGGGGGGQEMYESPGNDYNVEYDDGGNGNEEDNRGSCCCAVMWGRGATTRDDVGKSRVNSCAIFPVRERVIGQTVYLWSFGER